MNRIRRLYLEDFGILPDDGQNMAPFLRQAIEEAQALPGPCEISLRFGNYDIYADDLAEKKIFVTNTDSGKDGDEITRRFAVLFDSVQNIILNGNGSTIRFHGQMTLMGLLNCQDITLKNMIFETPHPTLTEMTVIALGKGYLDCRVHPDSRYRIRDGKIEWYGENFAFSRGVSQLYDPKSGLTWREYGRCRMKTPYGRNPRPAFSAFGIQEMNTKTPMAHRWAMYFRCGIPIETNAVFWFHPQRGLR